jgi:hypothetical protein
MNMVITSLLVVGLQSTVAHPEIDLQGRFYRAVFAPGPNTLSSGDLASVPEPFRGRLSRFLMRRSAFQSMYEGAPGDVTAVARDAKRRAIERAIVALIDADDIRPRALAFVKTAPIAHEWEGMPDGPLAESAYAEQLLRDEPKTPLAPFLQIFIAQRQRAAAEAAALKQDAVAAKAATGKYREALSRARAAADPIFALLADDLERVKFVYVNNNREKPGK